MKVSTLACILGAYAKDKSTQPENILDVGAGTGLLTLMMAQQYPKAVIDAIEIDEGAFHQAVFNVKESNWSDRISVIHNDFIKHPFEKKYDVIISNPPFFENHLKSPDKKVNLARHDSGLKAESFISRVSEILKDKGLFYVLLPEYEMNRLIDISKSFGLFPVRKLDILNFKNKSPKAVITSFSKDSNDFEKQNLIIRKDDHDYTDEFKDLLRAFYLHL